MADLPHPEWLEATLQGNFSVICERWPGVAEALSTATTAPFEAIPTAGLAADSNCVRVGGLQLGSAHNPRAEALLQASRIPEASASATVYGLGLGALAQVLLQRPAMQALRVVLLDPGVTKVGLAFADQRSWLQDSRLELVLADANHTIEEPFAALPPAIQLAQESCLPLRDALGSELQQEFIQAQVSERSQMLADHIRENESRVARDADVAELFGRASGGQVLVVGPGPTLADQFEVITRLRAGAPLIAISTALPSLLGAGIVPDLVVMIDLFSVHVIGPQDEAKMAQVPLVYSPEVQGETIDAWPGPRFAAYFDRPRYDDLRARLPRSNLWMSGTVAHCAVDLAVLLGAREVVLFGLDFAYPGGSSHAPGNLDRQILEANDRGRTLIDGHGERTSSDPNLIAYLRDLENYIAVHPEVTFQRADRRAAAVRGAQWLTT
jgi:hypothetical protein